eukprot:TRINITY_DN20796_c0_g1_i1.p1 TRINITY_DN20796_c0_g1~~TRINITY_DN20796_c0_g1_i1.p1  ORF type:complete len:646 (+),score=136.20 TRINITY_DN20796_c0_g1_i1:83-2020(+)
MSAGERQLALVPAPPPPGPATPSPPPPDASPLATGRGKRGAARKAAGPGAGVYAATWQKNHPLEGDGLLCAFYHYLFKKNKTYSSCPGVKLPDTIVYEHNFPRAWYTYDFKNQEIQRRQGKYLDTQHILNVFSKVDRERGCDICAQYLFTQENELGQQTTNVEFLCPADLEHFLLHRRSRPDGILQRFPPPRSGADSNSQIQVVWSPRVTLIQRRVNRHRINDRSVTPYERAVTYDGPAHRSCEGLCSARTKDEILEICSAIVDHFASTEHKAIIRLVCYFKISPIPVGPGSDGRDGIWLLWASSLRVGAVKARLAPNRPRLPLNLCPRFATGDAAAETRPPELAPSRPPDASALIRDGLAEVDERQFALSGDLLFRRMCREPWPGDDGCVSEPTPPRRRHLSAGGAPTKRPSLRKVPSMRRHGSTLRPRTADGTRRGSRRQSNQPGRRRDSNDDGSKWWNAAPHIRKQWEELQQSHRAAELYANDVVYLLYSHMQRREASRRHEVYSTRIPPQLMEGIFGLTRRDDEPPQPGPDDPPFRLHENPVANDRWEQMYDSKRPHAQRSAEAREFLARVLEQRAGELRRAARGGLSLAPDRTGTSPSARPEPQTDGELDPQPIPIPTLPQPPVSPRRRPQSTRLLDATT